MIDLTLFTAAFLQVWGETIHYLPGSAGVTTTAGAGREITACVERQVRAAVQGPGDVLRPHMLVYVANSATIGISAAELNTGRDLLTIPFKVGGTPEAFHIVRVLNQDEGMLVLEVC